MFGYVVVDKPNILIKDYQEYRSYYCGMCKQIGKSAGQKLRLTINYDITLLALFSVNLKKITPQFTEEHCLTHIVRRVPVAKCPEAFSPVVDINTILGYYKAGDDVKDERKLIKRIARLFLAPGAKKASKRLPKFAESCKREYDRLAALEKAKEESLDKLADPFAAIMTAAGKVFSEDENFLKLCYNLGRWIYIIDALDDLSSDYAHHSFNPFLTTFSGVLNREKYVELMAEGKKILNATITEIKACYDKMDITISEGPLSNIIYLGLDARTAEILNKGEENGKKSV